VSLVAQDAAGAEVARLVRTPSDIMLAGPVLFLGSYMLLVFGFLSRRCERQADVFGCRAGSCSDPDCRGHGPDTELAPRGKGLCPTGIDAFIRALERVEVLNDISRDGPRWRGAGLRQRLLWVFRLLTGWLSTWQHSTIAKRVAFLERIAEDLRVEQRFQRRVALVKWSIALGLIGALAAIGMTWGWNVISPAG
jgi:Zn-dependent protease with chaperone function